MEQRFAEPIATADAIEHWLRRLVPRLTRALEETGQGARSVELASQWTIASQARAMLDIYAELAGVGALASRD